MKGEKVINPQAVDLEVGFKPGCGDVTNPGISWTDEHGKDHRRGFCDEDKRDRVLEALQGGATLSEALGATSTGTGGGAGPEGPESTPPQEGADELNADNAGNGSGN